LYMFVNGNNITRPNQGRASDQAMMKSKIRSEPNDMFSLETTTWFH
jgi:hypothetical protein